MDKWIQPMGHKKGREHDNFDLSSNLYDIELKIVCEIGI